MDVITKQMPRDLVVGGEINYIIRQLEKQEEEEEDVCGEAKADKANVIIARLFG